MVKISNNLGLEFKVKSNVMLTVYKFFNKNNKDKNEPR
jgi:hypothetical protein